MAYLLGQLLDGEPMPRSPDETMPPDAEELDEAARLYAMCELGDDAALGPDTASIWLRAHHGDDPWIVEVADALFEMAADFGPASA